MLQADQEPFMAQPNKDQTNSTPLSIAHRLWDSEKGDGPLTPQFTMIILLFCKLLEDKIFPKAEVHEKKAI